MSAAFCSHCALPVGNLGEQREVSGELHRFCCYGCCLAFQVRHGDGEEPAAAWLLVRLGVGAFLAMFIMLFSLLLYSGTFGPAEAGLVRIIHALLWVLATPVLFILGAPFIRGAWDAALDRRATADSLVSLGVLAAYGYSAHAVLTGGDHVYFDTATMVLVLFTLGRYLEAVGRVRASRSLAPTLAAERATATVVSDDGDVVRPATELSPGAVVRIRPGERVPVDGVIIEGHSQCNEAVLSGQPEAQAKEPGADVFAGSINGTGQLLVHTRATGAATRWGQISRRVREALSHKSLVGELVDRAALVFVPWVIVLAVMTVLFWSARGSFDAAMLAGLAVLVVACPCALGLAAPLATAAGLSAAAEQGVLIRSGGVLERLARITGVAFDKTGTLTSGEMRLVSVTASNVTDDELVQRAAYLARASEHPIARSITAAARARGLAPGAAGRVEAYPGEGIMGNIDGEPTAMGSLAFMQKLNLLVPPTLRRSLSGCSQVFVAWGGKIHGLLQLADTPAPNAQRVVSGINKLGLATCLLSGDTPTAAVKTAEAMGIDSWCAELSPSDKVDALRRWSERHGPVAMLGDGINDGPVLAAASVGVAVGGATDLARETADVTLPANGLNHLPAIIELARRVRRIILTNIAWAFCYNVVALGLASAGLLQPVIAAGLMAGSSLFVIANSMRTTRERGLSRTPVEHPFPAATRSSL